MVTGFLPVGMAVAGCFSGTTEPLIIFVQKIFGAAHLQ